MSDNTLRSLSLVDSTYRIRWEITRDEFDNCQFLDSIWSSIHAIDIDGQESHWCLKMHPKGYDENDKDNAVLFLCLLSENQVYKVRYEFGIETEAGQWPHNDVKKFYTRGSYGEMDSFGDINDNWGRALCSTKDFVEHFMENKGTVVASFVIYVGGDKYCNHMEVAEDYMDDMRSMSSLENLTDFTIISGSTSFPCHRLLLAARSSYFEALFRNEPTQTETKMEEPPELVKTMLEFMSKGLIPDDIDDKAMDLILISDKYALDLLTVACETSMIENLSPENAIETLVMIDKVKHVKKSEHREKVLAYIKKHADKVVKVKDWKKYVQTYPDLITEILPMFHKEENNGTS